MASIVFNPETRWAQVGGSKRYAFVEILGQRHVILCAAICCDLGWKMLRFGESAITSGQEKRSSCSFWLYDKRSEAAIPNVGPSYCGTSVWTNSGLAANNDVQLKWRMSPNAD
jgi:hypothetical protein